MTDPLLSALEKALAADPDNAPLWAHYAELCAKAGRAEAAITAWKKAQERGHDQVAVARGLVPLLREQKQLGEALIRAEQALGARDDAVVRLELARVLAARGETAQAREHYARAKALDPSLADAALEALPPAAATASVAEAPAKDEDWAAQFDWGDLRITFADVVGLEAMKRQLRLRILAPLQGSAVLQAFGRKAGGGILLYGPPGCGKTFLARATAGELGARFVSVSIHEIVDKYWGESERLVHALFERARQKAPTVVFFDEFDALGAHRGRSESQFWRTLVNQMLQEMDGLGGRNEGVLVFAATNMPWNVDSAFRRPGRFDRVLFVPPPDAPAREELLARALRKLPGGEKIDARALAAKTALFSAADLGALCERAAEQALERSLADGRVHEVVRADLERELATMKSSALEWLSTAKNYAQYANDAGAYDEVAKFLAEHRLW